LQPYDLEGSVDDLNRPLVRIETPGFTDPLIAFVDTGFNGALLIDETQAARLGFSVARKSSTPVRLASQRNEDFLPGEGSFLWLGERNIAPPIPRATATPGSASCTRNGRVGCRRPMQRINQRPASKVHELTPRLSAQRFADNPLKSDLQIHC
jgi:hypothetical protein